MAGADDPDPHAALLPGPAPANPAAHRARTARRARIAPNGTAPNPYDPVPIVDFAFIGTDPENVAAYRLRATVPTAADTFEVTGRGNNAPICLSAR
ncbi:hypothetical protein Raf01_11160 [Rugosimonospora africana]|uniref:Uncharacterized protein n=1 Tax=Rugosimonospora africana TaxID=556532 RepID=A0A8J3QL40_9ACTN|nr:hypothetical protein Raf01_11160 [Rugosimonospora africana]